MTTFEPNLTVLHTGLFTKPAPEAKSGMRVWIVLADHLLVGVFGSREAAETYCQESSDRRRFMIRKWVVS